MNTEEQDVKDSQAKKSSPKFNPLKTLLFFMLGSLVASGVLFTSVLSPVMANYYLNDKYHEDFTYRGKHANGYYFSPKNNEEMKIYTLYKGQWPFGRYVDFYYMETIRSAFEKELENAIGSSATDHVYFGVRGRFDDEIISIMDKISMEYPVSQIEKAIKEHPKYAEGMLVTMCIFGKSEDEEKLTKEAWQNYRTISKYTEICRCVVADESLMTSDSSIQEYITSNNITSLGSQLVFRHEGLWSFFSKSDGVDYLKTLEDYEYFKESAIK